MANKRVSVSYGRTVQTAPYESMRLDIKIEKDVPADGDIKTEVDNSVGNLVLYVKAKMQQILAEE